MNKQDLAIKYNLSATTLRRLLNNTFFEELKAVGYDKSDKVLAPIVVRKFIELYGAPITIEDYEDK